VIDTRQYLSKPSASMLDLNSIHLDFVAQEQGYQTVGEPKSDRPLRNKHSLFLRGLI
jgi:FdhE protein